MIKSGYTFFLSKSLDLKEMQDQVQHGYLILGQDVCEQLINFKISVISFSKNIKEFKNIVINFINRNVFNVHV